MIHPMLHANNTGIDYQSVVNGLVQVIRPEQANYKADKGDIKYLNEFLVDKGVEAAWLRRDAMSGQMVKKCRVSLGLVEEWGPQAKTLDSLSRADCTSALTVMNATVFPDNLWAQVLHLPDKMIRKGLLYDISCSGDTIMAHHLKQPTRNALMERGTSDHEREGNYKYE